MKNSKADLVRGWLEKARRDLLTAERGLNSAEPFTDIVCFHAQQATEKHLKAYLLWHGIEFPRTHALEDLVLLAAEKDADFALHKDEVTMLTPYAVETRYPEFEEPLLEDAREMVRIARGIRDFVLVKLPETLTGTE
ncbi:HEPN domain-containing protein [Candidatus Bipolaricaulota bacterium]|nr:HEPN domain-containing protein [Candidatus Bipolaricaulota bacterium]